MLNWSGPRRYRPPYKGAAMNRILEIGDCNPGSIVIIPFQKTEIQVEVVQTIDPSTIVIEHGQGNIVGTVRGESGQIYLKRGPDKRIVVDDVKFSVPSSTKIIKLIKTK
jgi:hypothetical protein